MGAALAGGDEHSPAPTSSSGSPNGFRGTGGCRLPSPSWLRVKHRALGTSRPRGHQFTVSRGKDLLVFLVNLGSWRVEVGIRGDLQSRDVVKEALVAATQ